MRPIDAEALCDGRVCNDPVVIAAKCDPTVDAVPVVRCYECRKWRTPDCHAGHEQASADYCSHGIRKDGEPHA